MANVGANAFLNNKNVVQTIPPNPLTERGYTTIISAHPKEPKIIYCSGRFVVVRSLDNPNDAFIYRGHTSKTTVAKFSPNGFWVASADISGKVKVWSWDNPEHLQKLETSVFAAPVLDLDWDGESKKIVAVGEGASGILAKVFTWDTGNSAGEIVGHSKRIITVSCKANRPYRIMTGSEDMRTVTHSGPPYKFDASHDTHTNFVNMVRYSPDGSTVVSVGSDKKIQLYDGTSGAPTKEVTNAHDGAIFAVGYSPDSNKLVTASGDKTLKVWNVAALTAEATIPISPEPQIGDMQQSVIWVGNRIISLSLNGGLNVFNSTDLTTPPTIIQGHQTPITALYVDSVNSLVYTGSIDGVVIARNVASGFTQKLIGTDKKSIIGGSHIGKVVGIGFNQGTLVSVGFDDAARFASIESFSYFQDVPLSGQPVALASCPEFMAVATLKDIAIFQGSNVIASIPITYTPTSIAVHGGEVAVGGDDSNTYIYDPSLLLKNTIQGRSAVSSLAYSPDHCFLAIGYSARVIELYECSSWTEKSGGNWCYHTSKITCLAWSPSGSLLASGSTDENIYIWNTSKFSSKFNFPFSHVGGVSGVGWLGEKSLVSVGNDIVVATWNVPEQF